MEDGAVFLVGEEVNEYPREVCEDELLIELIKGHRVIWATQNRGYKYLQKKHEAWKLIASVMGNDAETLKSRCKNLRDGFVKCLKKMGEASKSGSSATKIHYCQYFEQLLFLKDSVSNRPSTSNVVLPIHVNESRTTISAKSLGTLALFLLLI